MTAAYTKWWTTLLSPPANPPPRPKPAAEIKAFIGHRREARYVRCLKGSPQKTSRKAGRSRLPQNRGREEKKGEAKYRSVNDSGMEGARGRGGGEVTSISTSTSLFIPARLPWHISPSPGVAASHTQHWISPSASASAVHTSSCGLVIFPDDAVCKKWIYNNFFKKQLRLHGEASRTTHHQSRRGAWANTWKRGGKKCKKKKTLKELKYNWGVAAGAGLLPRQKGWVQVLN